MSSLSRSTLASATVAAGACWAAFGVTGVLSGGTGEPRTVLDGTADYLGFSLFALALALLVPSLLALHLHLAGADGRLGRIGVRVAMAGAAAQCVVIAGIVVNGEEPAWFGIAAPIAILTWFAGTIAFAVAIRRADVTPRWVGPALAGLTVLALIGANAGLGVLLGGFLVAVGLRLVRAVPGGALSEA